MNQEAIDNFPRKVSLLANVHDKCVYPGRRVQHLLSTIKISNHERKIIRAQNSVSLHRDTQDLPNCER
jgi:hypothetical protein